MGLARVNIQLLHVPYCIRDPWRALIEPFQEWVLIRVKIAWRLLLLRSEVLLVCHCFELRVGKASCRHCLDLAE